MPHTAILPPGAAGDLWLSGPLVSEGRVVVAPLGPGGIPHQFLRVNFDTRSYNDGSVRADVSVENVLNMVGATTVTYDASIHLNGTPVFDQAAVEHFYLTRWRKTFQLGSFATVTPDFTPFNVARALPPYLPLVSNVVNAPGGPTFEILNEGAIDRNMPAHGGRAELAPFPDWTARYLVHKVPTQREYVLAHGDLSGSWPVHVREPESGSSLVAALSGVGPERLVSLDQRPSLWFDIRASGLDPFDGIDYIQGSPLPLAEYGNTIPGPGQTGLIPDNAHQPSMAYVPYLLTGDRYYAEEMAFWANYGMIRTSPLDRVRGANGILQNQETRGYAWALRNLADAAAYYPDTSPVRAYLSSKVAANLQWLDDYANGQDPLTNPLKLLWVGYRDEPGYIALWEQNYLAYAIDRANQQGFAGGLAHRDAIAKLQLTLFANAPSYSRTTILAEQTFFSFMGQTLPAGTELPWGAPYLLGVATVHNPDRWWEPANHTTFTTMTQVGLATQSDPGDHRPYQGFYGPEARLNLMMGVTAGWPGAQAAYDYLFPFIGVTNYTDDMPDLAHRPGWALDFYPAAPIAAPDGDGDGINDGNDNCPAVANADQLDFDTDSIGDACDFDDDGDGISDTLEIELGSDPLDPASTPEMCDGVDNDRDGTTDEGFPNSDGDTQSDCVDPDDDNDGTPDATDAFPLNAAESIDTDGDGIGNNADPDDDNDTRPDDRDPRPLVPNVGPTLTSPGPQSSAEGIAITPVQVIAFDLDGDALLFSAGGLPPGLAIDPLSGVITGTPAAGAPATNSVTVTVSDGLLAAPVTFTWAISNTGSGDGVVVTEPGVSIEFTNVTTPGSTQVTPIAPPSGVPAGFSVAGLPAFEITTTAVFSGPIVVCFDVSALAPDAAAFAALRILHGEAGVFVDRTILAPDAPAPDFATLQICARVNSLSPFALAAFAPVNQAPEVTAPAPPPATEGVAITPVTIVASDPDGDALTYSATGLPPGLSLAPGTNTISGTPTAAGSYSVTVSASDGDTSDSATFTWVVQEPPAAPISLENPGPQTNTEEEWVSLQLEFEAEVAVSKKHGRHDRRRPIHFRASGLPDGLHIHQNGIISGRVGKREAGTYQVTVTLRVGDQTVTQAFAWTILRKNRAPRLDDIENQTSTVGAAVSLVVRATDADGDLLTFTPPQGLPPGLAMNAAGVISGTVGGGEREYRVTVTVTDGQRSASGSFEWKVKAAKKDKKDDKKDDKKGKGGK